MNIRILIRGAVSATVLLCSQAIAQTTPADTEPAMGVPVTGAAGITQKVSEIMERARVDDARAPRPPRLNYEFENEWRRPKPNPDAPAVSTWPEVPEAGREVGPLPSAAQTVSTPNFTGATLADANAFPPDTMGTVGPTQFIVAINGRVRSFNKTTGAADGALNASTDTFFNSVMTPPVASNFTSDPRIRYDRLSGRWFLVIIDVPGGGTQSNRVLIAVSSGSTITSSSDFTFYQFQMSASLFADYPTLGIDANALYIGGNMFTLAGAFSSTLGSVVRKSSVLSGGPIVTTTFTFVASGTGAGPFTPQGVDNYDPAATEGYFVGVDNATFSTLMVRRVSTPAGTPTVSGNLSITVPTTTASTPVPHSGNTGGNNGRLDGLDDRLFAAHLRNGRLWTAHSFRTNSAGVASTAAGARVSVRWYELGTLTTTPSLIQSGTVFDSAATNPNFLFIPSIMVSGQGHAALGFSMAGLALTPNAGTIGRLTSDTLGTTQGPVINYSGSTSTYNPAGDPGGSGGRRWGDYSYTSLDPCDDMTMWTIQEFADSTNSYGVRAARLLAPAPVATNCASVTNIAQGQSNMVVPLAGTGFFEPAANVGSCRTLLGATASGSGVSIAPTFTSATSLSLSVSVAAGAAAGPRTLTITNPDGQTTTATGCINVTAPVTETISSLSRVGSGAICAGQALSWQATFSGSVSGGATSNFALVGGTGASLTGISGSGTTRTIATNVGTAAGPLRLDMANGTGVSPTISNVPFTGESVTINANPGTFAVTGGGGFCAGGAGVAVGLSGSQTGVNYQLLRDGNPVGSAVAGGGAALAFGNQSTAGTYTVAASNATTACATAMTGTAVVTANPLPSTFSVTGGGNFCAGGAGVAVSLGGSQTGVNYQLLRDGSPVNAPVAGTGAALNFGNQTSAGSYTVSASNASTSCAASMTGNAAVAINPVPSLNNVSPAMICTATATSITLASTPAGASFAYTASNTAGSVTGFGAGIANPIAQTLTGSGNVSYAVTPTLNTCAGAVGNVLQRVTDPRPAAGSLPAGVTTAAYSTQLSAPGALQTTQFQLATGSLPPGLTLSTTGAITGTPTSAGSFSFTVSGSDPAIAACSATRSYSIDVVVDGLFADGFE